MIKRSQVAGMNIHYVKYSLEYFLEAQRKAGFETIELWCGAPHVWLDHYQYYHADRIRKKIEQYELKLACVTPENCIYPWQVAAWEPEWRERSFQYFKNGIQLTAELGCEKMEINSGWGSNTETKEDAWGRSQDMLGRLAEEAQKNGIVLVIESLRKEESQIVHSLSDLKKMLEEIHHPSLLPMVDTCAMCCAGENLEEWFEAFHGKIAHMHFVDCDPQGHLIWGDGKQQMGKWIEILNRYQYTGYLGQEITDEKYYTDPAKADCQNMKNFEQYIK